MKIIKKLNISSVAKITGILYGGIYLIAGLVLNIAVLIFELPALKNLDFIGFGSGLMATFLVALLVGSVSFIFGGIIAWLYNVAASIVGGIAWIEIPAEDKFTSIDKPKEKKPELPMPPKPQAEVDDILKETEGKTDIDNNPNFMSS